MLGRPGNRRDEWCIGIAVGHASLPCLVRRSSRARRVRLTIDVLAGPIVTVPTRLARTRGGAERIAHEFVRDREPWLRLHLERRERRLAVAALAGDLRDGGHLQFRGERHRLRVVAAPARRRTTVSRSGTDDGDELVVEISPRESRPLERILEAWFRERARSAIQREIARHAAALRVAPGPITIRDQRTRWGSCSRSGRLSFSWRLVLAPPEVLETVVVHELAHLRVFGHGPGFWEIVAGGVPEHRRWRRWLRDHSVELHAALGSPAGPGATPAIGAA